jgi:hypothetical protein
MFEHPNRAVGGIQRLCEAKMRGRNAGREAGDLGTIGKRGRFDPDRLLTIDPFIMQGSSP